MPTMIDPERARRIAAVRAAMRANSPTPFLDGIQDPSEAPPPAEMEPTEFTPSMLATMLRQNDRPLLESEYPGAVQGAFPENRQQAGGMTISSRDLPAEEAFRQSLPPEAPTFGRSFKDPNFFKYQKRVDPAKEADDARRMAAYESGTAQWRPPVRAALQTPSGLQEALAGMDGAPSTVEATPRRIAQTIKEPSRNEMIANALERMDRQQPTTEMSPARMRAMMRNDPEAAKAFLAQTTENRRLTASERMSGDDNRTRERINRDDIESRKQISADENDNRIEAAKIQAGARDDDIASDVDRAKLTDPVLRDLTEQWQTLPKDVRQKRWDDRIRQITQSVRALKRGESLPDDAEAPAAPATAQGAPPKKTYREAAESISERAKSSGLQAISPKFADADPAKRPTGDEIGNILWDRFDAGAEPDEDTLEELADYVASQRTVSNPGFTSSPRYTTRILDWLLEGKPGGRVAAIKKNIVRRKAVSQR